MDPFFAELVDLGGLPPVGGDRAAQHGAAEAPPHAGPRRAAQQTLKRPAGVALGPAGAALGPAGAALGPAGAALGLAGAAFRGF